MIKFNCPPVTGDELGYISDALKGERLSGDGYYGRKCEDWFKKKLSAKRALLTPSCTHALEMAAILIDVKPGDEIIMPSYTFVSTANAFVLRGAKIVFVDIDPITMNISAKKIEEAVNLKTKAIVPVHYAGVACNMTKIMEIAYKYNLYVIEDAAQGISSTFEGKALGSIGHLGAMSFHETKNISSGGEGGLLIINEARLIERAEILREKGTNRSAFFRGEIDKYSWKDIGSNYLLSEVQAAFLWAQLLNLEFIIEDRLKNWHLYYEKLKWLQDIEGVDLPRLDPSNNGNGHIFYIKCQNLHIRNKLRIYLSTHKIMSVSHYVPLHTSDAGLKFGTFFDEDNFTTRESERLLRLPMWYGLSSEKVEYITDKIRLFFNA
jgi:dTDP-4-amino-4,6-dideoxygalactose transaminase